MLDVKEVLDSSESRLLLKVPLRGPELLDCPLFNKGSAFSERERREFELNGLLPYRVSTLEEQVARRYRDFSELTTPLNRFLFLRALQDRNETLYFRLLADHVREMLPIVYTPEVGEVCQRYSRIYHRPRGLYLSFPHREAMDQLLTHRPYRQVDVIVVTDGERILGLGDQGVGGMGIPVGKLALYTLCGGIHPGRTLPIVLDTGTDNPALLADPDYIGWRHARVRGAEYDAFIEDFVQAVQRQLPNVLLQWEDFAQANARRLLDHYRDKLCTFNDDIQGTAAVTVGALMAAVAVTGSRLGDQRFVFVGAGSAGTGISDLLLKALVEEGLAEAEARSRIWLISRPGLLLAGMKDLTPSQVPYAQPAERVAGWKRDAGGNVPLLEVVERVRPTALIGVSGQPGIFSQAVVRAMACSVERPIIFPLSNPTSQSEAVPTDLVTWSEGRALIATGSPFPDVTYGARTIPIGQCNNSYVFPGVGLGVLASGARRVTDEMFLAAARALAKCTDPRPGSDGPLLPPLAELRRLSRSIAQTVGAEAMRQGLARPVPVDEWEKRVAAAQWEPRYQEFTP